MVTAEVGDCAVPPPWLLVDKQGGMWTGGDVRCHRFGCLSAGDGRRVSGIDAGAAGGCSASSPAYVNIGRTLAAPAMEVEGNAHPMEVDDLAPGHVYLNV